MNRSFLAVAGALGGLLGVLGLNSAATRNAASGGSAVVPTSPSQTASASTAQPGAVTTTSIGSARGSSGTSAGGASTGGASAGGGSSATEVVTGTRESFSYGEMSIQVTLTAGKMTALRVVGMTELDAFSTQIADTAIPTLEREVLAAQSTKVHGVSGATYTTEAYLQSVQSVLDKTHAG